MAWIHVLGMLLFAAVSAAPVYPPKDPASVTKVHIIQSNHLDVGFADYASRIMNRYLRGGPGTLGPPHPRNETVQFPSFLLSAARTAATLRARGGEAGMRYMAQAYEVSYFIDCLSAPGNATAFPSDPGAGVSAMRCPNATEIAELEGAIRRGDIWWHAFAHNAQPELMDEGTVAYGVALGAELAARYGRPAPTTLSQRDVPGLSRAVIPALARAGVTAVSVGVNDGSPAPVLPSTVDCSVGGFHQIRQPFVWRDEASGTEVLADYHPGGYGGVLPLNPDDKHDEPYYSRDGVLCDCTGVPGLDEIMCYAWKGPSIFRRALLTLWLRAF